MAYKRTAFDKLRLHVGGITLVYFVVDLAMKDLWVPAIFCGIMLGVFVRLEGDLLDGSKPPKQINKK